MDKKGILNKFNKLENLDEKKLTKISAYFGSIGEKETMHGTYLFEDGTSKEGCSYNNNDLSGTIEFANNEDSVPINEFIQGLKEEDWVAQVEGSIDNFEGGGQSIDYDEDEFESFEEGNSDGCDYDARQNPSEISFHFGDKEVKFDMNYDNLYENKDIKYTKENIIDLVNSLLSDG